MYDLHLGTGLNKYTRTRRLGHFPPSRCFIVAVDLISRTLPCDFPFSGRSHVENKNSGKDGRDVVLWLEHLFFPPHTAGWVGLFCKSSNLAAKLHSHPFDETSQLWRLRIMTWFQLGSNWRISVRRLCFLKDHQTWLAWTKKTRWLLVASPRTTDLPTKFRAG